MARYQTANPCVTLVPASRALRLSDNAAISLIPHTWLRALNTLLVYVFLLVSIIYHHWQSLAGRIATQPTYVLHQYRKCRVQHDEKVCHAEGISSTFSKPHKMSYFRFCSGHFRTIKVFKNVKNHFNLEPTPTEKMIAVVFGLIGQLSKTRQAQGRKLKKKQQPASKQDCFENSRLTQGFSQIRIEREKRQSKK